MRTSLIFAILVVCSGSVWSSSIRTPLAKAFPSCDQQAIEFLLPLSSEEKKFIAEKATQEVVQIRYVLRNYELSRAYPKFRPGTFEYDLASKQMEEHERQLTSQLASCDPLVSKYARGRTAALLAPMTAERLDLEMLQRLISNGATLEEPPVSSGTTDNPNSVWKNVLLAAVGTELFPGRQQSKAVTQASQEKYIPFLLEHVKYINSREPKRPLRADREGDTILHSLATFGSPAANFAIKYLITQKDADPRIRNKQGRMPLDLYAGNDKEIMRLLSGVAPAVATSQAEQPPEILDSGYSQAKIALEGESLPKGIFAGFITSTLNKGERINGTLLLKEQGVFEYQGNNGVTLKGRFQRAGDNQIIGSGISQLPKLFGIAVFTYPDGTSSATLKFNGKLSPESISGVFESPHEKGTFAFTLADQQH